MHSAYNSPRHRCTNSPPSYPTLSTSWTACTIPDRMRARRGEAVDDSRRASWELDVAATLRELTTWCAGRQMIAMAWWRASGLILMKACLCRGLGSVWFVFWGEMKQYPNFFLWSLIFFVLGDATCLVPKGVSDKKKNHHVQNVLCSLYKFVATQNNCFSIAFVPSTNDSQARHKKNGNWKLEWVARRVPR